MMLTPSSRSPDARAASSPARCTHSTAETTHPAVVFVGSERGERMIGREAGEQREVAN